AVRRLVFGVGEVASKDWWRVEEAEEARCHEPDLHLARRVAVADREVIERERRGAREGGRPARQVRDPSVLIRGAGAFLSANRRGYVDAVRRRRVDHERRRPEQEAVDDAEHRRVGANAERKGQDDRGGEAGLRAQAAESVAEVLPEGVEHVSSTR